MVSADVNSSGGNYVLFTTSASTAIGNYQEYTLPSVAAGTYTVDFYYKSGPSRGINQASVDGVNIGGPTDEYTSATGYQASQLGSVMLTAGNHLIRFTITGKNGSASNYQLAVDKIVLALAASTDTGTSTATTTATGTRTGTSTSTSTSTSTITGNCITTLISNGYAAGTASPCSTCNQNGNSLATKCSKMIDCLAPPKTQADVTNCQNTVGADSTVADCVSALTTAACPSGF
jgi:hypothetical protein